MEVIKMTDNLVDIVSLDIIEADCEIGNAQNGNVWQQEVGVLYWVAAADGYKMMEIMPNELHLFEYTAKYPVGEDCFGGKYSSSNLKGEAE